MYLFEFITSAGERTTVAVADPDSLFNLCYMCNNSDHVKAWRINNYSPQEFGWSFNPEVDSKCRVGSFEQGDWR